MTVEFSDLFSELPAQIFRPEDFHISTVFHHPSVETVVDADACPHQNEAAVVRIVLCAGIGAKLLQHVVQQKALDPQSDQFVILRLEDVQHSTIRFWNFRKLAELLSGDDVPHAVDTVGAEVAVLHTVTFQIEPLAEIDDLQGSRVRDFS